MGLDTPTDAARPSAAQDWRLVAAMTIAAHPVALVLGLALIGVSRFVGGWGLLAPPISWALLGLAARVTNMGQLPGRAIRPADEPELTALVRVVAERLDFQVPLLVRVVPVPDASLIATKVGGVRVFVLVLGWPLLRRLTTAQLAAVVAHELAHELHATDRRTSALRAARESLAESLDGFVHVPAALAGRMLRATQGRSWAFETAADASSADVAGSEAVRTALEQTGSIAAAFERFGERWTTVLAEDGSYPCDLYEALDAALDDPYVARQAAAACELVDAADAADPYAVATHPPLAARSAALAERPAAGWDPLEPVTMHEVEALDSWCVQALVGPDEPSDALRPVRVLDCEPERFEYPVAEAYDALVEATGCESVPDALDAVVAAIADGAWVQLARAIDPEIGDAPPALIPAISPGVIVGCLGQAVSGRLLEAGWPRASRWTTSVLIDPDADHVDVRKLIEQALNTADVSELRSLVALGDPRAIA